VYQRLKPNQHSPEGEKERDLFHVKTNKKGNPFSMDHEKTVGYIHQQQAPEISRERHKRQGMNLGLLKTWKTSKEKKGVNTGTLSGRLM